MPAPSAESPIGNQRLPIDEVAPPVVIDAHPAQLEVAGAKRIGVIGWLAILWISAVLIGAVLAPLIVSDPDKLFIAERGQGPQVGHPFGLDGNGADLFAKVVWGARTSLLVAVLSIVFGMLVGGALGLIAGFYRGVVDTVLTTMFNVFLAIPALVLALALVAVFASGDNVEVRERIFWLVVAIGLVSIPILGRIARASALTWSQREFVLAARAMGAKSRRLMLREVLPNVLPAMFSIALLSIAVVIVIEGGLSILGVGVPADTPSWGNLIAVGRNELSKITGSYPQVILAPSLAIFLTVLSLNYLGDIVRARFDVRESAL